MIRSIKYFIFTAAVFILTSCDVEKNQVKLEIKGDVVYIGDKGILESLGLENGSCIEIITGKGTKTGKTTIEFRSGTKKDTALMSTISLRRFGLKTGDTISIHSC